VERLLTELPDLEVVGLLQGASNYTFLAQLGPHPPSGIAVVYKPARGESPLWDLRPGRSTGEVAAYRPVRGWPRIPPTVVRDSGPHGVGALQLFVEADRRHFLSQQAVQRDTWLQIALFDVIANNADRKSGHCLFDADDRVWVIDHGLTFHTDPKLRTVLWDFARSRCPRAVQRPGGRAHEPREGDPGRRPRSSLAAGRAAPLETAAARRARPGLAVPRADLGLVGALAPRLTRLVTFRGCG
jgi:hypothetical protein